MPSMSEIFSPASRTALVTASTCKESWLLCGSVPISSDSSTPTIQATFDRSRRFAMALTAPPAGAVASGAGHARVPEHVAARLALRQHQLLLAQAVPERLGLRRHRIRQRAIDLHGVLLEVRRAEPSRRPRAMSRQWKNFAQIDRPRELRHDATREEPS